jgi:hypothetical protein
MDSYLQQAYHRYAPLHCPAAGTSGCGIRVLSLLLQYRILQHMVAATHSTRAPKTAQGHPKQNHTNLLQNTNPVCPTALVLGNPQLPLSSGHSPWSDQLHTNFSQRCKTCTLYTKAVPTSIGMPMCLWVAATLPPRAARGCIGFEIRTRS